MRTIRRNDSGEEVTLLQNLLISWGHQLVVDGIFGHNTENAVRDFQRSVHISSDGIVGSATWHHLQSESGRKLASTRLSDGDYERVAKLLGVDVAAVKAVWEVETGGRGGFFDVGYPSILFEGHIFWQQLKKQGIDPQRYVKGNEDIIHPKWDRSYYVGGIREHDRLKRAIAINRTAALCSASWGAFQIMGFDYAVCGCSSVEQFVESINRSEGAQLDLFAQFIKHNKLDKALREHNWAEFARGYNGPSYAENKYDQKLAMSYAKYSL